MMYFNQSQSSGIFVSVPFISLWNVQC